LLALWPYPLFAQGDSGTSSGQDDVPVTIKELDVPQAIREFKNFQERLGKYRDEMSAGRSVARETSQIIEDLRQSASEANGYNEGPIFEAVTNYVG